MPHRAGYGHPFEELAAVFESRRQAASIALYAIGTEWAGGRRTRREALELPLDQPSDSVLGGQQGRSVEAVGCQIAQLVSLPQVLARSEAAQGLLVGDVACCPEHMREGAAERIPFHVDATEEKIAFGRIGAVDSNPQGPSGEQVQEILVLEPMRVP